MNEDCIERARERDLYVDRSINRFVAVEKTSLTGTRFVKGRAICSYLCYEAEHAGDVFYSNYPTVHDSEYIEKNMVRVHEVSEFADFDGIGWKIKDCGAKSIEAIL